MIHVSTDHPGTHMTCSSALVGSTIRRSYGDSMSGQHTQMVCPTTLSAYAAKHVAASVNAAKLGLQHGTASCAYAGSSSTYPQQACGNQMMSNASWYQYQQLTTQFNAHVNAVQMPPQWNSYHGFAHARNWPQQMQPQPAIHHQSLSTANTLAGSRCLAFNRQRVRRAPLLIPTSPSTGTTRARTPRARLANHPHLSSPSLLSISSQTHREGRRLRVSTILSPRLHRSRESMSLLPSSLRPPRPLRCSSSSTTWFASCPSTSLAIKPFASGATTRRPSSYPRSKDATSVKRLAYIARRCRFLQELSERGDIRLLNVPGTANPADALTKHVSPKSTFRSYMARIYQGNAEQF